VRDEHLQYFKALLEGRADISWRAWFARNEAKLTLELPRAVLLRLKFDQLDEAEKLLSEAGVRYTPHPTAARRERYYAQLHPSVLDERGRPREAFMRKAYRGAVGLILDGKHDEARERLAGEIKKIRRKPTLQQAEALADMCFDGEMSYLGENREVGRALLKAVASVPLGDDLLDPTIQRALELLAE